MYAIEIHTTRNYAVADMLRSLLEHDGFPAISATAQMDGSEVKHVVLTAAVQGYATALYPIAAGFVAMGATPEWVTGRTPPLPRVAGATVEQLDKVRIAMETTLRSTGARVDRISTTDGKTLVTHSEPEPERPAPAPKYPGQKPRDEGGGWHHLCDENGNYRY